MYTYSRVSTVFTKFFHVPISPETSLNPNAQTIYFFLRFIRPKVFASTPPRSCLYAECRSSMLPHTTRWRYSDEGIIFYPISAFVQAVLWFFGPSARCAREKLIPPLWHWRQTNSQSLLGMVDFFSHCLFSTTPKIARRVYFQFENSCILAR